MAFDLKGAEGVQWQVLDILGKTWDNGALNVAKGALEVNLEQTPKGIYFLRLTANNGETVSRKFTID